MKVTLIAPQTGPEENGVKHAKAIFPPLSLMTVAALTPPEVEVELIDEAVHAVPFDTSSELIGITVSTAMANRAYAVADQFRRLGKRVVLGGIHVTALPEEAAKHADAVVVGEAEGKWQQVLRDFEAGNLRRFYADEARPSPGEIPIPRRDLINPGDYLLANTVQTTRGCPFQCTFCSVSSFFGRTYRTRPVENVIREVRGLDGKLVLFVDDNIMGHPAYARQLFAALKPMKKRWLGQASLSMLSQPDLIALAAESGCAGLFVGMETLTDATLERVAKRANRREDYEHAISLLHENGIAILAAFIFGFDEDDESVFQKTVDFVNRTRIDAAQFSVLTPFPGTEVFDELQREGRITDGNWSRYDGTRVVFRPARLEPEALTAGMKTAYRQVYSPGAILRRIGPGLRGKSVSWIVNLAFRQWVARLADESVPARQTAWDLAESMQGSDRG